MSNAIRQWGVPVPPEELVAIDDAASAFRAVWASILPPWPAAFDGTVNDVRAIDYLQYEGIAFPPCGVEGAALVCGEVLRRAARLEWVRSHAGDWFVASPEGDWPSIAICPVVRVQELQFAGTPQFGKFIRFMARAAFDCLPFASEAAQSELRHLLSFDEGYLHDMDATLAKLGQTNPGRR